MCRSPRSITLRPPFASRRPEGLFWWISVTPAVTQPSVCGRWVGAAAVTRQRPAPGQQFRNLKRLFRLEIEKFQQFRSVEYK